MMNILIVLFLLFSIGFNLYILKLIDEVIALIQYLYGGDDNE